MTTQRPKSDHSAELKRLRRVRRDAQAHNNQNQVHTLTQAINHLQKKHRHRAPRKTYRWGEGRN